MNEGTHIFLLLECFDDAFARMIVLTHITRNDATGVVVMIRNEKNIDDATRGDDDGMAVVVCLSIIGQSRKEAMVRT